MEAKKITTNTINLSLKTLTPVHIGSGNELKLGIHYFYEPQNKQIGKADFDKISGYIKDVNDWANKIVKGENIFESLAYKGVKLEDVCSEILPVKAHQGNYLFEFVRNRKTKNPVIPGSSIKGAIRTALLTPALEKYYKDKADNILKNYKNYIKYDTKLLQPVLEIKASSKSNPQNNIFKYIQVSDAPANISGLYIDTFQTLNLRKNDSYNPNNDFLWYIKKQLTQNKEVFEGEVSFSLRIDERFFEKNKLNITGLKDFFKQIHGHTIKLLDKEIENFKIDLKDGYFTNPETGHKIIQQLKNIKSQSENKEDVFLLRMSAGSGWDYMTGAWFKEVANDDDWDDFVSKIRNRKYKDFPFPKTRRLTSELKMPGFVLLTIK